VASDQRSVKIQGGTLTDQVRTSPVDDYQIRHRWIGVGILVLIVVLVALSILAWRFLSDRPVDYSSDADHFKYGSIGSEPGGSLFNAVGGVLPPYPIFTAMPSLCPELLPGGYASLGFVFEPGKDLPIGISRRRRLGFDQVGLNCAVCHTGTVRETPDGTPRIVLGMPAHQLDLQRFFRFVIGCTLSDRFTADNVIGKVQAAGHRLGFVDRFLYRRQVIPRLREATLQLQNRVGVLLGGAVPAWGPGRVDTFNPYKAIQFGWPLDKLPCQPTGPCELIGAADLPSLWNQKPREGMQLHWDGNNSSVDERNLSAALGAGVTPVTVDHRRLARVRGWIWSLPPPPYPFPIDAALAARGEQLYAKACLACHADHRFRDGIVEGERVGKVAPLDTIGTDPYRLDSYTALFAANQYTLFPISTYRFTRFRKTDGYANHPLDGIWARAPYLHNGSVPTLRDLLEPPANRPQEFFRGSDVFDQRRVGFVFDVERANGRVFTKFDTRLRGNGNGGHVYGTALSSQDKAALVEYLKRL
jgi:hypothetical protein